MQSILLYLKIEEYCRRNCPSDDPDLAVLESALIILMGGIQVRSEEKYVVPVSGHKLKDTK
jgi:hypothetical protein